VCMMAHVKQNSLSVDVPQVMKLRQTKNELERKVQDQEEELDEQAGTIQQLEQVAIYHFFMSLSVFVMCMSSAGLYCRSYRTDRFIEV